MPAGENTANFPKSYFLLVYSEYISEPLLSHSYLSKEELGFKLLPSIYTST